MFDDIREDLVRARRANHHVDTGIGPLLRECFNPGTQALIVHRFGVWTRTIPVPLVRQLLIAIHFVLEYVFGWRVGIFIPVKARIAPGLVIHTWSGGIVLPACPIGRNLTIIGGGIQFDYDTQSVGEACWIAPGTKFVGKIRIGDRVRTAPNAVVQRDVPDDTLAFGNPARFVPLRRWNLAPTGSPRERAAAAAATTT